MESELSKKYACHVGSMLDAYGIPAFIAAITFDLLGIPNKV
jgi:hypothetical protein